MQRAVASLGSWLLSHLVAIGFLGFLVVAIVWRDPLFGLNGQTDQLAGPADAPPSATEGSGAVASATEVSASNASSSQSHNPLGESASQSSAEISPVLSMAESGATEAGALPDSDVQGSNEMPEQNKRFRPTGPQPSDHRQFVPVDLLEQAKAQPSQVAPLPPERATPELANARMAFSRGVLDQAEANYLRYLAAHPEDAIGFAELGNLYRTMGRRQDALDAYFEAGMRFRSSGDRRQLQQVIDILAKAGDARLEQLYAQ